MTPSRLTASLARGRVGSISPSTFRHVLRLVQREYVPEQRAYSTIKGKGKVTGNLRAESSLQAVRRAVPPSVTRRRFASRTNDRPTDHPTSAEEPGQTTTPATPTFDSSPEDSVFRFWSDNVPVPLVKLKKRQKPKVKKSKPGEDKAAKPTPVVARAKSTFGVPDALPETSIPGSRELPPHVMSAENEEMRIRTPKDRRSQMTRLDGDMEYDRYFRRYTGLSVDGPPRILNQGAPTDDPDRLTRDANWYRHGYTLGNVRRIPKPEDKLKYLDETKDMEPGQRNRLRDVKRILKPKQGTKRFGFKRWSSDPLQTRFFRRRIGTPPSTSRNRESLVVEQLPKVRATALDFPRNRYSSRRRKARRPRTILHFPLSTIFPRLPSRSRRRRIRVRVPQRQLVVSQKSDQSTTRGRSPPLTPPSSFSRNSQTPKFAKLQQRVISGAVKLFTPRQPIRSPPHDSSNSHLSFAKGSQLSRRPKPSRDGLPKAPLFPEPSTSVSRQHQTLDLPDFVGLELQPSDHLRILNSHRAIDPNETDLAAIETMSEFLANPLTSLDHCGGADCSQIPGTLSVAQLKSDLVDPRQFDVAELIAIIESMPKESTYLASTNSIRYLVYEFQRSARPSEWLWLAHELVAMLQAVTRGSQRHFEPTLVSVAYAVIALALARSARGHHDQAARETLQQLSKIAMELSTEVRHGVEASRSDLDEVPASEDNPTTLDSDHQAIRNSFALANEQSILAAAAGHLGDWEGAREQMTLALSLNLERAESYPKYDLRLLIEYYELLASNGRLADLVKICFTVRDVLLQTLLMERDSLRRNHVFCRIFYSALANIDRPVDWLDKTFARSDGSHDSARVFYAALTRFTSKTNDALELAERMYTHNVYISLDASARLCGTLFRLGRHEEAQTLYGITRARNSRTSHMFLSTMLNLFSDAGLFEDATDINSEIVTVYGIFEQDQLVIPTKLASLGRAEHTLQALRNNFGPAWADDERLLFILFRAHYQADDVPGAERLHRKLLKLRSGISNYNLMIDLYAKQGDTNKALDVFRSLLESGIAPDVKTFERLVHLFTNRQDLSNVSLLLDAMSTSGIKANAQISSLVIQTHVNAGDWLGAAKCWRSLPTEVQSAPHVAGAILRAFVMLGTPPAVIFSVFQSIDQPTAAHWSFLLLSYCDAGQMEAAANVFETMDHRSRTITKAPAPDLFTFSILMYGYLRNDNPALGRATFDEMLRRHVMPSSVTYSSIIQSFLNSGDTTEAGLGRVHRFAMSIHAFAEAGGMGSASRSQSEAVRDVFAGMVTAAGNSGHIETAQAYFDVAVPNPNQPKPRDLRTIGRLMNAYRKANDMENVMKMWRLAFNAALSLRGDARSTITTLSGKSEDGSDLISSSPSNLLCVSLSIAMGALGDAGNYTRLKEVWNEARMEGFGFSPSNFIDYAVALVKCGDVEGAFYVVSKVLVPRDRRLQAQRKATMDAMRGVESRVVGVGEKAPDAEAPLEPQPTFRGVRHTERSSQRPDPAVASSEDAPKSNADTGAALDDTEDRSLSFDKTLPLPQRMSAALYSSELAEQDATYDPELFGDAKEFAKEGPPAIASTLTNTRQPTSYSGPPDAKQRSELMAKQESSVASLSTPAAGVNDLTSHLLTHLRPADPSWRPSFALWEIISRAYGELQGQRKELSEQVTAARLAILSPTFERPPDTINLSTEKRLDELDPRRQPREMVMTQFNNVVIRDRHGRPMKSTPVVVLWRLNAIYPDVVKGIYSFRKYRSGHRLQELVAQANRVSTKTSAGRHLVCSPGLGAGDDTSAVSRSRQEKERIRRRDRLLDKVKIPASLIRDRDRYGMTVELAPTRDNKETQSVPSRQTSEHDRRTAEAMATVMEHRKKRAEQSSVSRNSRRLAPEYESILRHGRKRVAAKVKVLTPKLNLKRLGVRQSTLRPGSINYFAHLVEQHEHIQAKAEKELESRATAAKRVLKETNYGELMEDFRVRKTRLQAQYQRAETEAEEYKQRANG